MWCNKKKQKMKLPWAQKEPKEEGKENLYSGCTLKSSRSEAEEEDEYSQNIQKHSKEVPRKRS